MILQGWIINGFDYQLVVWSPTIMTWLFGLGEQDKGTAGCVMVLGSHSSVAPVLKHTHVDVETL